MVLRYILFFTALFYSLAAMAVSDNYSHLDLISSIDYFQVAPDAKVALAQAKERFNQGNAVHANRRFLTFGISNQVTWVRLSIDNPTHELLHRRLTTGQIWVGSVDVYQLENNQLVKHSHAGDWRKADKHLLPGVGYVFDMTILPGKSDIYIRSRALDPLTLPIELVSQSDARNISTRIHISSGLLYGILIALVGFNFVLYTTLKQLYALYYSIYISCFIVMNFGYNGYAFAWLYPNSSWLQNYCTLFFMVLHGVCGLIFVSNFLHLRTNMPRLYRLICLYIAAGLISIVTFIILQMHYPASFISFNFLSITTLIMIFVGIMNLRKAEDARYFLLAVSCSMLGLLATTLSVWGIIPYTFYGFHGAAIGVVCEAVILAVIVANRLKEIEKERITAQYLATYDPLTKLFNRRSFLSSANKIIDAAQAAQEHVSFVMMDIDFFKLINDTYGHHVGDLALEHIAQLLQSHTRKTDIVARWGGEEVVILLAHTKLAQAINYAEHLREIITSNPLIYDGKEIRVTASFGVCTRMSNETLEQLYQRADSLLYKAKNQGRNMVKAQNLSSLFANTSSSV